MCLIPQNVPEERRTFEYLLFIGFGGNLGVKSLDGYSWSSMGVCFCEMTGEAEGVTSEAHTIPHLTPLSCNLYGADYNCYPLLLPI